MKRRQQKAWVQLAAIFVLMQAMAYLILVLSVGQWVRTDIWLHGLAGPLMAVEASSRFRYHSVFENARYVILAAVLFVLPAAYPVRPRRLTLVISVVAIAAWTIFGMLHSIHHM